MEKVVPFTVILGIFVGGTLAEAACFKAVVERPMNEEAAKRLSPECREMRAAYVEGLKIYAKSPSEFETWVRKRVSPPSNSPKHLNSENTDEYRATVVAAAFGEASVLPALDARAKAEASQKARYAYATAAAERIRTGECSSRFEAPEFEEVCRVVAPAARRLVELARAGEGK